MIAAFLLLSAAASAVGAQATAQAHARVVRGERLSLAAPMPAPDRQLSDVRKAAEPKDVPMPRRLIELH